MARTSYLPEHIRRQNERAKKRRQFNLSQQLRRLRRLGTEFPADREAGIGRGYRNLGEDPFEGALEIAAEEYGLRVQTVYTSADPDLLGDAGLARYVAEQLRTREELKGATTDQAQQRLADMPEIPIGSRAVKVIEVS